MTIAALTEEARRPLEREPGSDDDDETPAIDLKALRREEEKLARKLLDATPGVTASPPSAPRRRARSRR